MSDDARPWETVCVSYEVDDLFLVGEDADQLCIDGRGTSIYLHTDFDLVERFRTERREAAARGEPLRPLRVTICIGEYEPIAATTGYIEPVKQ